MADSMIPDEKWNVQLGEHFRRALNFAEFGIVECVRFILGSTRTVLETIEKASGKAGQKIQETIHQTDSYAVRLAEAMRSHEPDIVNPVVNEVEEASTPSSSSSEPTTRVFSSSWSMTSTISMWDEFVEILC